MEIFMERILNAANNAPSGENCQPWRFVTRGSEIELHLRPERDVSAYNWGQRGSYMACGAALENMLLAASAEGYMGQVRYFPGEQYHVATVSLSRGGQKDPLADAISLRVTNRKPYSREPLSAPEREGIRSAASVVAGPTLRLIEESAGIEALGRVGSINEEVMLTNKSVHRFFFDHINWTAEDDARTTSGFFIDTLELPPPARFMFKLLRSWPIARTLTSLGIHKVVGKENGATNARAAAIGVICGQGTEPLDYVLGGRQLERVWLAATAQGLSLQPLTGVLFLRLLISSGEHSPFNPAQKALILKSADAVARTAQTGKEYPLAMFRIGKSEPPTARSSRFPLSKALE